MSSWKLGFGPMAHGLPEMRSKRWPLQAEGQIHSYFGVYKCKDCHKRSRVTINTVFESSDIALRVWLQAVFLVASSKKGISSNQLSRTLGITVNSGNEMGVGDSGEDFARAMRAIRQNKPKTRSG